MAKKRYIGLNRDTLDIQPEAIEVTVGAKLELESEHPETKRALRAGHIQESSFSDAPKTKPEPAVTKPKPSTKDKKRKVK